MSRPYVSIDIETTGIDDRSHILQISAVFDDLHTPVTELPTLDLPIKWESISYSEPYALGMNAALLTKMMDKNFETYSPKNASSSLVSYLLECQKLCGIDENGKQNKIIIAGKNVASFDIPKIRSFLTSGDKDLFDSIVHYKTLDVGSLYYDVFGDNVSLSKINELTGRKAVSHNALDDAFDVVYAVRHKMEKK
jgi:oligoribonuclease (3'-5' exoribonuclease)